MLMGACLQGCEDKTWFLFPPALALGAAVCGAAVTVVCRKRLPCGCVCSADLCRGLTGVCDTGNLGARSLLYLVDSGTLPAGGDTCTQGSVGTYSRLRVAGLRTLQAPGKPTSSSTAFSGSSAFSGACLSCQCREQQKSIRRHCPRGLP